ncbi:hypothetical protein HW555_011984 [Spodoptera exigua]|uniref:Uncharacterized protein n=1 Tax=Spodoptera exigua TaxID=7107 RepID=A0A835G4D9_SPOEX|nr:hypothetical protein HW555_011984 [Spodoptera exigua]
MPAPSNLEEIIRKVVMEERAFTRACFAGIEDRLLPEKRLRPPLAADKVSERTPSAPGPSTAPAQRESKGKGKGKGKKTTPAAPTAQTVPQDLPREDPLLPSTTPSNQPWVKVVSKKRKGKKKCTTGRRGRGHSTDARFQGNGKTCEMKRGRPSFGTGLKIWPQQRSADGLWTPSGPS